jgi:hypothetical protein
MKTVYKFILLIAAILVFDGCNKYVDGPKFSLRTKKARLTNTWKLDKLTIGGTDVTADFLAAAGDYKMTIHKDGTYKVDGNFPDDGKWELGEDKDDAFMTSNAPNTYAAVVFRILKLKSKEMTWRHTESNGTYTIYYFKAA